MSYKTSLELAYHMGYEDALARKMPDADKVAVLLPDVADGAGEYICGTDGHEGHWLTGEEIVRCGDCRYYDEIIHACDHPCVTPLRGDCPENWIFSCFDNDFCAWGRRKEDA